MERLEVKGEDRILIEFIERRLLSPGWQMKIRSDGWNRAKIRPTKITICLFKWKERGLSQQNRIHFFPNWKTVLPVHNAFVLVFVCMSICLFICLCVFVSFFSLCLCVSFPACRVGADRESTRNKSFYCFLKRFFVTLVTVVSSSRSTEHLGPFLTMSQ